MTAPSVVRMANRIADVFRAYPAEEAEAGLAGHILPFREPRMREEQAAEAGCDGLAPPGRAGAARASSA